YGAIGAWLYCTVAGINPDMAHPGYKHTLLSPHPGGGLKFARATLQTPYGKMVSGWEYDGDEFKYSVVVPPNTTATVNLPCTGTVSLNGETVEGQVHEITAGSYEFVVKS
ncbi:MAG: alpha-L-rhamnosidase, partial [Chloroflexi bacterium]|nr:alpha-L-rhamnosidase [Chloroflexota bacterium]